jgi:excisionase family DNA binding protein
LADALRLFVRDALHQELASLKDELLYAIRAPRPHPDASPQTDMPRLLSVLEVADRVGCTPATVREWIKDGYLHAVALGPAGRRYGIRWADVEASLVQGKKREIPVDADAEASQILAAARVRATRRRGA